MATLCGTRTIKRLIFKDCACRARLTVQGVSGTPLDATKRASRIGPFCTMNHGSVFVASSALATASNGLTAGLDPPAAENDLPHRLRERGVFLRVCGFVAVFARCDPFKDAT
jgi:hypothetical protein